MSMKRGVAVILAALAVVAAVMFWPRETRVVVPGGNGAVMPRVTPEDQQIDPAALSLAADYAGERKSTSLIVSRRGHIVFEKYWHGADRTTLTDTHQFGETLMPLLDTLWKRLGAADAEIRTRGSMARLFIRQEDWLRVAELEMNDGVYQGDELLPPGTVRQKLPPSANSAKYVARDVVLIKAGPNRLWVVPSLRLGIFRSAEGRDGGADWDDTRIPDMIVLGLRDFVPPAAEATRIDPSNFAPH